MYPEGFNSTDRDYVNGLVYAPVTPKSEYVVFGEGFVWFDYIVIPLNGYEYQVHVECTGHTGADARIDFEHTRVFLDVEDAQDWVYSFMDDELDLNYEQVKGLIRNGR